MAFGDTAKSSKTAGTGGSYGFGGIRTQTTPSPVPTPIAEATQTKPVQKETSLFPRLINLLNIPSEKTEEFLTGDQGYDVLLEKNLGLKNVKGKIDPNDITSLAARMLLDPLNLLPVGLLGKLAKFTRLNKLTKAVGKIKPVSKVASGLEDLFVPFARLKKVAPQLAEELPLQQKATQALKTQAVRKVAKTFKETPVEIKKNLGKLLEKLAGGGTLKPEELVEVNKAKSLIEQLITLPEKELGLLPKEVAEYFPRKIDKETLDNLLRFSSDGLSTTLRGSQKARKFLTQEAGEAAGVKYKGAVEALAERAAISKSAQSNAKYIKRLISGKVKDIEGNALVQPISDVIAPGYKEFTIKGLKGMQAPAEAVSEIEKYYKTFTSDEATNVLLGFYDKALGVWKASVTSIFPSFHIRNVLGNLHNMWLGGFGVSDLPLLSKAKNLQLGEEMIVNGTKVTKNLLEQLGIVGKGQFGFDIPKVLEAGTDKLGRANKFLPYLNPFKSGRAIGTALEENSRIAFFLQRLGKGDDIYKARSQVAKFLFDYTELTGFEKNAMKRIIPFYTWMRKNIPLQIEQLAKQPQKYAALAKVYKEAGGAEEEKSALPAYLREGFLANLGKDKEGKTKFLSAGSFLPFEDLGKLFRGSAGKTIEKEILSAMSPMIKAPFQLAAGRDVFFGEDLENLGFAYGSMSKSLPDSIKKLLQYKEGKTSKGKTTYWVNPNRYVILQNLPVSRALGIFRNPVGLVSPLRVKPYDIEQQQEYRERESVEDFMQKLLMQGKAKKFENIYIPKEKKKTTGFGSSK